MGPLERKKDTESKRQGSCRFLIAGFIVIKRERMRRDGVKK